MKAAIILNGEAMPFDVKEDFIICADGGCKHLKGKAPDCIIGDMDSLNTAFEGTKVIKYSAEKNQTDGELCVEYAVAQGYTDIALYCALGGRLDHTIGNLALLKFAHKRGARATIVGEKVKIYYAEESFSLNAQKGDIVSIIPYGGDALIESASGLRYALQNLWLKTEDTRGISNIAVEGSVSIKIACGAVLIFHNF